MGIVDLDEDTSFMYNIDGSHVFVAPRKYVTKLPGSATVINNKKWYSVGDVSGHYYSCRISRDDSYLLVGYHGVQDYQLSSSPFLTKTSLASSIAFGPARSRLNAKPYLISDSGIAYGLVWRPSTQTNKFLKVKLNSENEITGAILFGTSCPTKLTLKFYLEYKTVWESSSHVTKQYSTVPESYLDVFIHPHFNATVIELHITEESICEGFQWDLTGRLTVL
ncbi:uncharacterized protein LOC121383789 [Gigantopelta aegis]|uniref:uncharacterized protein LOC121383789 n=1 Tax=Gigantopelta aegis TaxID=1735272 RepID=UPI001B88A5CD|nr:uncharacterized protein LOC121383789 [Gigantopelta aegis]